MFTYALSCSFHSLGWFWKKIFGKICFVNERLCIDIYPGYDWSIYLYYLHRQHYVPFTPWDGNELEKILPDILLCHHKPSYIYSISFLSILAILLFHFISFSVPFHFSLSPLHFSDFLSVLLSQLLFLPFFWSFVSFQNYFQFTPF